MSKPETDRDIENVEAWAEVIADVLYRVPADKRAEVLALATKNEEADRREREANGDGRLRYIDMSKWGTMPPPTRNDAITRLQSLIVQVFVRDIANNHSPKHARDILFVGHPHGTGSGLLEDYLPNQK
jgi:hypothetical protein